MRVKSGNEAVRPANIAGPGAAKPRIAKADRKVMSAADDDLLPA